ncbi:MAG: hypothetical protein WCT04_06350 [Planctomycetota bacterium]
MKDRNIIKAAVTVATTALVASVAPGTVTLEQSKSAMDAAQKQAVESKLKLSQTTDAAAKVLAEADYQNKFAAFGAATLRHRDMLKVDAQLDQTIDDCAVQLGESIPANAPSGLLSDKLAAKGSWFSRVF